MKRALIVALVVNTFWLLDNNIHHFVIYVFFNHLKYAFDLN